MSLLFASCSEEFSLDEGLTPPGAIIAPANDAYVEITPASDDKVVFSWGRSQANDGGLVLYEVFFTSEKGDIASPAYRMLSDGKGVGTTLTLSHKQLNQVANTVGINPLEKGKIRWTVAVSKGYNQIISTETRVLEVLRPDGFANVPSELFLFGSAAEQASIANAIKFYQVEDGVFECITSLKAGDYQLISSKGGDGRYFTSAADGKLVEENQAISVAGESKVVRISVDFTNAVVSTTDITKFTLIYTWTHAPICDMEYVGGGVFEAKNQVFKFVDQGGFLDERYKFMLETSRGAESYGSYMNEGMNGSLIPGLTPTDQRPDGGEPAYYHNLYKIDPTNWWVGCYKFASKFNGSAFDMRAIFDGEKGYYHTVTPSAAEPEKPFEAPEVLFLRGTATENGAAYPLRKRGDGVFELFTQLNEGSFFFADKASGDDCRRFAIAADGAVKENAIDAQHFSNGRLYKILVNFESGKGSMIEILKVEVIAPPLSAAIGELIYQGNHIWQGTNINLNSGDTRFRFRIKTTQGFESWGSYNNDSYSGTWIPGMTLYNPNPGNLETAYPDYYNVYDLAAAPGNLDWVGCWQLPIQAQITDKYDYTLNFSPETKEYRYAVTKSK